MTHREGVIDATRPASGPESEWVIGLRHAAASDPGRVGRKAANLAILRGAGFPVPDGIVVTTDAFVSHLKATRPDGVGTDDAPSAGVSAALAAELRKAAATFGDLPLAVRSSGVAEDLSGASYAGQYETVLGVRGPDELVAAVERCWSSAFAERVSVYRGVQDTRPDPMGVLIQPLVEAEAAGVAFTADPVTGDPSYVAVSAVRGLGERLVSGEVTPDEWTVHEGQASCRTAPERAIGAAEVARVADLARRVEAQFGSPQDIEWALGAGTLYLLQARPITTPVRASGPAGVPLPIEPPTGFWEREVSHFPQPLSPLFRSFLLGPENAAFRALFGDLSLLLETIELREIGGYVYQRTVPLGGKDRQPPPPWLFSAMVRVAPPLRARVGGCVRAVRSDLLWGWVQRWHGEWKPWLLDWQKAFRAVDLNTLDDEALARHMEDLNELFRKSFEIHMRVNGAQNVLLAQFFLACRELLGWDETRAVELLSGLSEASGAPARALSELAARVRGNPELAAFLQAVDAETRSRMSATDPGFGAAFEAYLEEFGCRTIRYELTAPTLAETPEWALSLLRDQLERDYDPAVDAMALSIRRAGLTQEASEILAERSATDRARFDRELARAQQVYPLREEHAFYDSSAPTALMRYAALEVGARLADRGQIESLQDVFFLELDEASASLREGSDQRDVVRRRQAERSWALANPGPASHGTPPPPPPSFAALPSEARFLHEAILWALERVFATQTSGREQLGHDVVSGIAASAGSFTGPVRVIRDESEFHTIRAGEVLVCPITSPVWSVLFPSIGALVTDAGGILSHSAIIAREYRIPAVVATGNGTTVLRTGDLVTVDGSAGVVLPAG